MAGFLLKTILRYKSILVEKESYLLQLVRYIHNNPVKAGLAGTPGDYTWSSHKAYLSEAKIWGWVYKQFPLSMLTANKNAWKREYRKFMAVADVDEVGGILEEKKWPSFLGSKEFAGWVKCKFYGIKRDDEIPQTRELAPETERIIKLVSDF